MADTTFVDESTVIEASWLNEINDFYHTLFSAATSASNARTALGLGALAILDTVDSAQIDDDAITTAKIAASAVGTSKISNDSVTLAKITSGTAGDLLIWNGAGNPTALAAGNVDEVLTMNASVPTWSAPPQPTGAIEMYAGVTNPTGYLFCYGQAVSRSTYSALLTVLTITDAGNTTNSSATVTGISDTSNMRAGMAIEGTGIPSSTTISSVDSGTQITLNQNATADGTGVTLTVFPFGNGDESTTFNTPDLRDRVPVGQGDLGGTDANRLSSNVAEGLGFTFGAASGSFTTNTYDASGGTSALNAQGTNAVVQPGIALAFIIKT